VTLCAVLYPLISADRDVYYHSNNYDAHCKEYYIGNTQTEMIGLGYGITRGVGSNSPE